MTGELPRLPARRSIAEKPPLYSVRRDSQRPETEVAAFGHERELVTFMVASQDKLSTEIFFVLRHNRRRGRTGDYTVIQSYSGRLPPMVIDHEPIESSMIEWPRA